MAGISSPTAEIVEPIKPKKKKTGSRFPLSDLGNAERFESLHGDRLKWDIAANCWRYWDGRRWAVDDRMKASDAAGKTARSIREEASAVDMKTDEGRNLAQRLFKFGIQSESEARIKAMTSLARSKLAHGPDEFDSQDFLFNCANGTIDLKTGILHEHQRGDLITKLSPVEFKSGIVAPRFNAFLEDATGGDIDVIRFLQKLAGYCLTGSTTEEKAIMLFGGTATGKSTFLESLRAVCGDYAKTINTDLLAKRRDPSNGPNPELATLKGARLACGSEMESGRELGDAFLKSLTGGEVIQARHLYGSPFDFFPKFKIVLALNHCPRASADDAAVWRRLLRVGIDKTVPPEKRDKSLKPYLRDPEGGAPAVLAWAAEGCLLWQKEGLEPPEAIRAATADYRSECDPLAQFIEDCISDHPAFWTPWSDIWDAYNEHSDDAGIVERYRVSPKRLQARLKELGGSAERRHEGRGWAGIELKGEQ